MRSLSSTSNFNIQKIKQFPGLLGALSLFLLVEVSLGVAKPWLTSRTESVLVYSKRQIIRMDREPAEILILGDSSAGLGIDAEELERLTGKRVLQMTTVAPYGVVGNYFLFREYLKFHQAPRKILWMCAYDTWFRDWVMVTPWPQGAPKTFYRDSLFSDFYFPMLQELPGLFRQMPGYFRDLTGGLLYLLPSHQIVWNHSVWSNPKKGWEKMFHQWRARRLFLSHLEEGRGNYRSLLIQEGVFSEDLQREMLDRDIQEHVQYLSTHPFRISDINQYFFKKLLKLCETHGVEFILLEPPLHKSLKKKFPDYFRQYRRQLDDFLKPFPGAKRLWSEPQWVSEAELTNAVEHLRENAAKHLTEQLAHDLEALL